MAPRSRVQYTGVYSYVYIELVGVSGNIIWGRGGGDMSSEIKEEGTREGKGRNRKDNG